MRFYMLCVIICFCFGLSAQKIIPDSVHLNIIRNSDNDSLVGRAYLEIEWRRKHYKQAYLYLNDSKDLRDSVYNLEKTKQIDRLNTEFETERNEAEINRPELEEQLNQSQIKQQRLFLRGSSIGLAALSFLLFRLFGQNEKINTQNSIISQSLNEKEILLIRAFRQKLNAEVTIESDQGTKIIVDIQEFKLNN